jgi:hypothetical protein
MIDIKGPAGKHIELIKSGEDIDSILQKGGDAARRTIYAIHQFKELMDKFRNFRFHIESQNSLLKLQDGAVRSKEFSDAERAAETIKDSFEEEKKFYQFLVRKEEEERTDMLKAFGEMKDITLLGNIMAGMAKASERINMVRAKLYKNYEILERVKKKMGGAARGEHIDEINKLENEIAENANHLREESDRIIRTEAMIRDINNRVGAVAEQRAEKGDEGRIKRIIAETGSRIRSIRKEGKKAEEGVAKVEVEQQRTEKKEGSFLKRIEDMIK